MLYNKPRTQNAVLTLPYWELKRKLPQPILHSTPCLTLPYWELKQALPLQDGEPPSKLTLPYWELKLAMNMVMGRISCWLTLPYWELKRGADPKSIHMDNLTLPYWELKLPSPIQNVSDRKTYLTLLGIETREPPKARESPKVRAYLTLLGILSHKKAASALDWSCFFCLMSREVSYIDESRIVSDEEKRYGRMYNRGRIIFSYYKWANF